MKRQARHHEFASAFAVLLVITVCVIPGVARGHAYPDHADPEAGSTVTVSPERVRIWFDSALEPVFSTIMVHAVKGDTMVSREDGRVNPSDPTLLEIGVPPLPPGDYVVYWSVVARDGHQTFGKYTFTVRPGH